MQSLVKTDDRREWALQTSRQSLSEPSRIPQRKPSREYMKTKHALYTIVCCTGIGGAFAATSGTNAQPDQAGLDAALKSCAASASRDTSGQPDRQAVDTCMSGKGYTRPSGPPPGQSGGQGHPPPPPSK